MGVGEQEPLAGLDQAGDAAGVEGGRDGADAAGELVAGPPAGRLPAGVSSVARRMRLAVWRARSGATGLRFRTPPAVARPGCSRSVPESQASVAAK